MRINKYISNKGFCSRREAARVIEANRVTINGIPAKHTDQVNEGDLVLIDGESIKDKADLVYIAMNKPVGITCTAAKQVENNIMEFINYPEHIFPIGRLDKDSQGLILLTNDGDIVNKILRSEHNHEKEYIVTVDKQITDLFIRGMSDGVEILNTITKPCKVERIGDCVFRIVLSQGLNRQIRRMSKAHGYYVEQLVRIRIMNIELNDLPIGEWRELTEHERVELFKELEEE